MQSPASFTDLGVDPVKGADWMGRLGVNVDDLLQLSTVRKLKTVFKALGKYADSDDIIRKITARTHAQERLDRMLTYLDLREKHKILALELEELGEGDGTLALKSIKDEKEAAFENVTQELKEYEK